MKLIFEKSVPGRGCSLLPPCDVETVYPSEYMSRKTAPALPEISETEISRHYTELCRHTYGVNCGFYPLGSCTMKYNPRIDEEIAALPYIFFNSLVSNIFIFCSSKKKVCTASQQYTL